MRRLSILVLLVAFIISCGNKSPESMLPEELSDASKNDEKTKLLNKKIAEGAFSQPVSDDYRIGPGDLIEVTVYEAQDLSDTVRVNSRGVVTCPLLGEVELGTLTTQEAEDELERLLGAKYMRDPHVSVFVKEYRSKLVAVIGAVRSPGNYELLGQGSLLDALALAGGLNENAAKTVYLTRQGEGKQFEIDLDQLLVNGDIQLNLPVRMGDTVFVPEAGTYYINGAVASPGTFRLKDDVTVTQAVEIAGGLSTGASGVKLLRYQNGEREVIPIDIGAIQEGEQKDIALQDQDVLYVGKNPLISLFQSLRFGLRAFPFIITGGL
jgi:Periplasmic protein involved in polysaccharide export